jgi:hypothetical protein
MLRQFARCVSCINATYVARCVNASLCALAGVQRAILLAASDAAAGVPQQPLHRSDFRRLTPRKRCSATRASCMLLQGRGSITTPPRHRSELSSTCDRWPEPPRQVRRGPPWLFLASSTKAPSPPDAHAASSTMRHLFVHRRAPPRRRCYVPPLSPINRARPRHHGDARLHVPFRRSPTRGTRSHFHRRPMARTGQSSEGTPVVQCSSERHGTLRRRQRQFRSHGLRTLISVKYTCHHTPCLTSHVPTGIVPISRSTRSPPARRTGADRKARTPMY